MPIASTGGAASSRGTTSSGSTATDHGQRALSAPGRGRVGRGLHRLDDREDAPPDRGVVDEPVAGHDARAAREARAAQRAQAPALQPGVGQRTAGVPEGLQPVAARRGPPARARLRRPAGRGARRRAGRRAGGVRAGPGIPGPVGRLGHDEDLLALGVLDDVGHPQRGDDDHARRLLAAVDERVGALGARSGTPRPPPARGPAPRPACAASASRTARGSAPRWRDGRAARPPWSAARARRPRRRVLAPGRAYRPARRPRPRARRPRRT